MRRRVVVGLALLITLAVGWVAGVAWSSRDKGSQATSASQSKAEKLCSDMLVERARIKDVAEARVADLDPGFVEAAAEVPQLRNEAVAILNDPSARPEGFWAATADLAQHCARLLISAGASSEAKQLCQRVLQVPEGKEPSQGLLRELGESGEFTGYIGSSTHGRAHFATGRLRTRCVDIVSP